MDMCEKLSKCLDLPLYDDGAVDIMLIINDCLYYIVDFINERTMVRVEYVKSPWRMDRGRTETIILDNDSDLFKHFTFIRLVSIDKEVETEYNKIKKSEFFKQQLF